MLSIADCYNYCCFCCCCCGCAVVAVVVVVVKNSCLFAGVGCCWLVASGVVVGVVDVVVGVVVVVGGVVAVAVVLVIH